MKMLEQRIGRRRDATRALTQVPTGWDGYGCPTTHTVGQKAVNPRGMGTASPFQKSSLPNSKKMLTKGGESWSARVPRTRSSRYRAIGAATVGSGFLT
jgi:hypothetical protein